MLAPSKNELETSVRVKNFMKQAGNDDAKKGKITIYVYSCEYMEINLTISKSIFYQKYIRLSKFLDSKKLSRYFLVGVRIFQK